MRSRSRVIWLLFSGVIAGAGCSGSQGGAAGVDSACNSADGTTCLEYVMTSPSLKATLEASCIADGATVVAMCPRAGLIGVCTLPISMTGASSRDFFYRGNAANLQTACASGTWSTTP